MNSHQTPQTDDSDTLAGAGDASAWLDEHGDVLYRYARSRVGHREVAEDLVQDALLAALESRERFQGQATIRTWLLSILRHKIVDHLRRAVKPRSTAESDSVARPDPLRARYFSTKGLWTRALASWRAPDQALEDREFWDVLDRCLSRLPQSLSAVFILRELEDLDTPELRRILDLSEGNLRVRLHRARLLLRECLQKHWFVETAGGSRRTE
ncbi:MAG: sigma-70 family RNA polymerase sigma factor [Isosphaeraceae bacterium]